MAAFWPTRFPQAVHILQHRGILAPWNVQQYGIRSEGGRLTLSYRGADSPVVFYHFHGFYAFQGGDFVCGGYPLSREVQHRIYGPYRTHLEFIESSLSPELKTRYPGVLPQPKGPDATPTWRRRVKLAILRVYFKLRFFRKSWG